VTFFSLLRLYLRRHRTMFFAVLALVLLHDVAFMFIFQFWKKHGQFGNWILSVMPGRMREGMGMPLTDLTDPRTYLALVMLRPDFRVLTLLYGVVVGTDVIAGEVGRGTAELVFSHPVRRRTAVFAGLAATLLHLLCLGAAMLLGFKAGVLLFPMGEAEPSVIELVPSVALVVLASMVISTTAFLWGSLCSTRGRAIAMSLFFILMPLVLSFMGLFSSAVTHLARLFPEHYYRPHSLLVGIRDPSLAQCAVPLAVIGVVAIIGAVWFAERRDLA